MRETDIAVVGLGAAGLSLAHRLALAPALAPASVLLLDAPEGPLRPPARTWCWWERPGGRYDHLLTAAWDHLRVYARDGRPHTVATAPHRYKMLRSGDLRRCVTGLTHGLPGWSTEQAAVQRIRDLAACGEMRGGGPGAPHWRARWVFDSRPLPALPPARTTWWQVFAGHHLRTARPAFAPDVADLMDFRVPQPPHGLAFGYVLPLGPREALVEYTEFRRAAPDNASCAAGLRHYSDTVLRLPAATVLGTERGAIPMTDARFPRRDGRHVFRLGTAGGATRPATGYTFAGVQRQTRGVAEALAAGRVPLPPRAHPARGLGMDAVLLRALDTGRIDGAAALTHLWRTVPPARLLAFLDGATTAAADLTIGARMPWLPLLLTAAELPLRRRRPGTTR